MKAERNVLPRCFSPNNIRFEPAIDKSTAESGTGADTAAESGTGGDAAEFPTGGDAAEFGTGGDACEFAAKLQSAWAIGFLI